MLDSKRSREKWLNWKGEALQNSAWIKKGWPDKNACGLIKGDIDSSNGVPFSIDSCCEMQSPRFFVDCSSAFKKGPPFFIGYFRDDERDSVFSLNIFLQWISCLPTRIDCYTIEKGPPFFHWLFSVMKKRPHFFSIDGCRNNDEISYFAFFAL